MSDADDVEISVAELFCLAFLGDKISNNLKNRININYLALLFSQLVQDTFFVWKKKIADCVEIWVAEIFRLAFLGDKCMNYCSLTLTGSIIFAPALSRPAPPLLSFSSLSSPRLFGAHLPGSRTAP